jgi:hypothetical protein
MRTALKLMLVVVMGTGLSIGCEKEPAPTPPPAATAPPAAAPAPVANPDAAPKPKMVAPTDGLSLADRIAKRQKEEKKLAEELAGQEKERLLKYDKTKLPLHQQVFAAIKKVRESYDKAKSKEDVEKIRTAQQKAIDATGKKMATIDPKGGNSNVVTDYDVMLDALSNGYPDALSVSFGGDKQPLTEVTTELDRRQKKVETWLADVKAAKK